MIKIFWSNLSGDQNEFIFSPQAIFHMRCKLLFEPIINWKCIQTKFKIGVFFSKMLAHQNLINKITIFLLVLGDH